MKRLLKNQKGLTMMEVLVTVAILAIVVVPCLSSFVVAQKGNVLAKEVYNEYTEAANLMEELKAIPADSDWKEKVGQALAAYKDDSDDGIDLVYAYEDDYYTVTVLVGEPEQGQENSTGKIILKGVIAP